VYPRKRARPALSEVEGREPSPAGGEGHGKHSENLEDSSVEEPSMIEQIRTKIQAGQYEFSKHAVDQSILRQISVQELQDAIASGEIIEDYPKDK